MSSFRQIFNIFSWLEPLNYYPDGGNGDFQCFNSFLTATFYFVMLNNLVLHIRNIFFVFSHCDGWLREFDLCVPHIYNPVEQKVMAGQFHAPSHPGVLKNVNMNGNIRDILLIRISRGANNCGQHSLEKNIYFIMRFSPHFQLFYFNDRLEFCEFFEWKIKRINNADLFSQPPLLIFIKGANISGGHCMFSTPWMFPLHKVIHKGKE